jgi:hypothetical protein
MITCLKGKLITASSQVILFVVMPRCRGRVLVGRATPQQRPGFA